MRLAACLLAALACVAQEAMVDQAVEKIRNTFEVPGMAVAVVKDGKAVLAKGYGVRKLGETAPVTARSLFGIASNTKAFTAAALAILVDEKKAAWDDPVIHHLPYFQMYDPYVTREMTVRDLLVHRSGLGLGAGDLLYWPPSDIPGEEIIRRLRFIKPASSFRSKYAYDNILYLVAGQVVAAASGMKWDEFIRERIFRPVGMIHSNTSVRELKQAADTATPHAREEGRLRPIEPAPFDNNPAAAAINSPVEDMAKWIAVQLNRGALPGGGRLFSAAQSHAMWSPQTIIPVGLPRPETPAALRGDFSAYGLGWGLGQYRGRKTVTHSGALPGYASRVLMVPDLNLGVVVLTNQEATGPYQALVCTILDHYMQANDTNWAEYYRKAAIREEDSANEAVKKAAAARNANSRPSLAPAGYAGRYRDAWYGDMVIENAGGRLAMRFTHTPQLSGDLEHWQYDTFIVRWRNRTLLADAYVTFALKPDGAVDQVKMAAVSPLTDFSFDFQDLLFRPVK
ncbi:MAG: serine hydrolase [Bryobacteraceae bacterium]